MTKKLRILLGSISVLLITVSTFMFFNQNVSKDNLSLQEQRESHAKVVQNSPFKETLKWDKKKRKNEGLPPNRYFEQMWELTVNPSTGKLDNDELNIIREDLRVERQTNRNPGEIGNAWEERGPNDVGGRTRVIMFDPNDASNNTVYAGGVSGGLWKNASISSQNSQWTRVQNVPGNLAVTSITVDPNNSNRWFVGTGEQYTAGDVVGNGVYVTTDGGASWNSLNIPAAGAATFEFSATNLFLSGFFYVNDVLAWNNSGNTELFVAVGAQRYGNASSPNNYLGLQTAGLYHSSDGGTNWNRIESTNMEANTSGANTYYVVPNDLEVGADNKIWMGSIANAFGSGGGKVYSSTNGTTWTEAAASPLTDSNRVELEPSATNPNKLYALTQGAGAAPVHIYSTSNGFGSISSTNLPNDADSGIPANDFCRGQAFYDLVIEADPNNDNIVYVGGIDLFRTTNSGSSWSQLSHWYGGFGQPNNVHADQHSIAFGNNSSSRMLFGNDGGVYYSGNSGSTISKRVNGYNVTQYVKAGIGPDGSGSSNVIFTAGAQDNGSQGFRGNNTTPGVNGSEELSDGDGFYTFVDKDGQYMIATYVFNQIYRFNLPWNGLGRRQGGATTLSSDQSSGDFVNQMGYDSDANRLLTNASSGTNFRIKSINVASNSNGTLTNAALTAKPTAFRASPFTNNTWYVGLANGSLVRLTNVSNSSATFTAINTPFVGSVSSVRYGATANDIFVTIHNYGVASVWSTSNGGTSWENKEGNLPNLPVRDMLQNPLDRNEAILATQLGVWSTNNFNDTNPNWVQAYNGMSDASVTSLDYWAVNGNDIDNKIIASTYGRGVFTGKFTGSTAVDNENPTAPTGLTASNITEISLNLSWTASTDNVGVDSYDILQDGIVIGNTADTSFSVSGLSASTQYNFTVVAKDAEGNISNDSNTLTVSTISTSTGCSNSISSFPYTQGFESGIGAWTQSSSDNIDWTIDSNGTPSSNTGPASATEGSNYIYVEASGEGDGFPNRRAIFTSPCFDLSALSDVNFSFQYHMFGSTDGGSVDLEVSTNSGANWTSIWNQTGNQGNQWLAVDINLADYIGSTIQLRFNRITGGTWQSDVAIDDISLSQGGGSSTEACDTLNFNDFTLNSFSTQDNDGANSIGNGGASLTLSNNTWKYIDFPYTVTQNTVIELEFSSTSEGEIHGIGFENDNALTSSFYFKFYGTQNYGVTNFDNYTSGTVTYVIPVGDSYTGIMDRLVFINDNDASSGNNSTFTNVKIYETSCSQTAVVAPVVFGERLDILGDEDEINLKMYPNPVKNMLHVEISGIENASYRIVNMLGQTVLRGFYTKQIEVETLNNGVYFLEINSGKQSISRRFIKQ